MTPALQDVLRKERCPYCGGLRPAIPLAFARAVIGPNVLAGDRYVWGGRQYAILADDDPGAIVTTGSKWCEVFAEEDHRRTQEMAQAVAAQLPAPGASPSQSRWAQMGIENWDDAKVAVVGFVTVIITITACILLITPFFRTLGAAIFLLDGVWLVIVSMSALRAKNRLEARQRYAATLAHIAAMEKECHIGVPTEEFIGELEEALHHG